MNIWGHWQTDMGLLANFNKLLEEQIWMRSADWLSQGELSDSVNMKQFAPCYLPALGWTRESLWLVQSIKKFIIGYKLACRMFTKATEIKLWLYTKVRHSGKLFIHTPRFLQWQYRWVTQEARNQTSVPPPLLQKTKELLNSNC